MDNDALRVGVAALMPEAIDDLRALAALPSVSFPGFPEAPVRSAAEATASLFRRYGFEAAGLLEMPEGYPAIYGETPAPTGAPTVLLYAHYDVQPASDQQGWTTEPWTPTERDGRLYGRGVADDKSGILMHAAALRLAGPDLPVGVKLVVEGEEETTSHLPGYVDAHPDLFRADVILVADMGNHAVGRPMLVSSLRGEISIVVTVRVLSRSGHSGAFGGPVPDAMMALVRILDSLTDERGDVAVAGLASRDWTGSDYPVDELRRSAGMLDGIQTIGSGSIPSQLWCRPAATVIGIDAPTVLQASNSLLPSARAKVSFRTAAPLHADLEANAIVRHIHEHAPFGAHVETEVVEASPALAVTSDGPARAAARRALTAAFGVECGEMGSGGSIPLLAHLAAAAPSAEFILFGAQDARAARIHGANESVDIVELQRMILAEALMLRYIGEDLCRPQWRACGSTQNTTGDSRGQM